MRGQNTCRYLITGEMLLCVMGDRDQIIISGQKYDKSSQNGCMKCHSNKKDFRDKCHNYVAVKTTAGIAISLQRRRSHEHEQKRIFNDSGNFYNSRCWRHSACRRIKKGVIEAAQTVPNTDALTGKRWGIAIDMSKLKSEENIKRVTEACHRYSQCPGLSIQKTR